MVGSSRSQEPETPSISHTWVTKAQISEPSTVSSHSHLQEAGPEAKQPELIAVSVRECMCCWHQLNHWASIYSLFHMSELLKCLSVGQHWTYLVKLLQLTVQPWPWRPSPSLCRSEFKIHKCFYPLHYICWKKIRCCVRKCLYAALASSINFFIFLKKILHLIVLYFYSIWGKLIICQNSVFIAEFRYN